MRENVLVNKQRGSTLTAEHVNMLSRGLRRFGQSYYGSGTAAVSATFNGSAAMPPHGVELVEVISMINDRTYSVRRRYYDHNNNLWTTRSTEDVLPLDASEAGGAFIVGEKVPVFWHVQRKAFMPLTRGSVLLRIGKTAQDFIAPSDIGVVNIWRDGEDTGETLDEVRFDWITNNIDLPEDTEVFVGWFPEEGDAGIWRIIGAACS